MNDGSTDNSGEICNQYAEHDSRIKVIYQTNSGANVARDAGVKVARGEWISFIDSDDWIEPDMYDTLINAADQDTDIIWCGVKCDYTDNSPSKAISVKPMSPSELIKSLLVGTIEGWMHNKLVRADLMKKVNMDNTVMMMEDMYMSLQLFAQSPKITFVDKELYHYIIHSEASTGDGDSVYCKAKKNIDLIYLFLNEHKGLNQYIEYFAVLAMRLKIAIANKVSLTEAKSIYLFAHMKINAIPLNSGILKLLYWIYFNTGIMGELLFKNRRVFRR